MFLNNIIKMKLLNALYAAIGVGVTVVAITVGMVNKTVAPTQQAISDLSYLNPQTTSNPPLSGSSNPIEHQVRNALS